MTSEVRVAHGILAGAKLSVKPLIGSTLSTDEAREYFRRKQEEINQGLELIPDKIRIRNVSKIDVERFSKEPYRWRRDQIPQSGDVLIEGEYTHDSEFGHEFNIITKTQLALCLYKQEHVFLKSLYSFSKDTNDPNEWYLLLPIPIPELFCQFGISIYPDDKDAIINVLKKINAVNFWNNSSMRIACSRFLKSHHHLDIEDMLIDLMISFEALFIQAGSKRTNKGHRIGKRCSEEIKENNAERKQIHRDLKRAWNLRSYVLHSSPYDVKEIDKLLPSIQSYLRRSILHLIP